MSMDDPNIHRRGFTLIELLVVIAIIALLVSILVPSLSEAQWMTKMAMCQSNLHHVGLAVGAYMTSYGMDHPFIFHGGTGDGTKESSLGRGPSAGPGNPAEAMLKDGYENFLDDAEPFFCPCAEETFETHYDMYGVAGGGGGWIWGTYGGCTRTSTPWKIRSIRTITRTAGSGLALAAQTCLCGTTALSITTTTTACSLAATSGRSRGILMR